MSESIRDHSAISMYEHDMALYSIIVNRRRSLPMIQDGLKPVQRRVIYGAFKEGLYNGRNDKSSALVGLVMAKYHPHGDSSIYDTIVNLANWFRTKYPVMSECETNYGNISTPVPAAMRYTHAGLSNFGHEVFTEELSQSLNIVDWLDAFKRDGNKEPEYLPAKIPILLINGSFGIGLGMTVNVPSHNLVEVLEVTRALLKNPKHKFCLIPDLTQECDLIDTDWQSITDSGNGSFKIRGRIETIQDKKGNIELHIRSLPQMVSTTDIYDKIIDMIDNKELPMIKDIFNVLDANDRPDITIHLKSGVDPEYVKNIIWAKTQVMKTPSVNFEAVDMNGIDTKRFSYREYLLDFIDYRMNTKFRLYCNKLQQVLTRHHEIDAFIKVLESGELDTIINMIRKQKSVDEEPIIEYIIKKCHTTDIQAKFIIHTNISKLTLAHLNNYREERSKLESAIKEYTSKVTDDGTLIKKEIDAELLEIEKKYGTPRLCRVISASEENNIPAGIFKIVVTERNYIRKVPDTDKVGVVRKDNPKFILRIDNTENLLLFDNKGKVFNLPVHKIPITDKQGSGTDIRMLVKNLTADIVNMFSENIFKQIAASGNKHYLTILSKNNFIKKLDLEDFLNVPPSGLIYTKLSTPEDEVVGLALVAHNLDLVVGSKHKVLRFSLKDVPLIKRNSIGNKCLDTEDFMSGMSILYPDVSDIIVVTNNGKINRFSSALLTAHKRGCKGQQCIKLDSNDEIFTVLGGNESDSLRIVTADGIEIIPIKNIKVKSSIAPGQRILTSKSQVIKADIIK